MCSHKQQNKEGDATVVGATSRDQASRMDLCKNAHFQHLTVQHLARYSRKGGATPPPNASELAVYSSWHPWWCIPVSWRVPRSSHPPPHPSIFSLLSVSCSQLLYLQPSLCCLPGLFDVEHKEQTEATNLCCPEVAGAPSCTRLVPVAMKQRCLLSFINRKCILNIFLCGGFLAVLTPLVVSHLHIFYWSAAVK